MRRIPIPRPKNLDELSLLTVSALRLGRGLMASTPAPHLPERPLELYEYEGCPASRLVREALTELDLDYVSRPCAPGSPHRAEAATRGGRLQFPLLFDVNAVHESGGLWLYDAEAIVAYLYRTYGPSRPRWQTLPGLPSVDQLGSTLAGLIRARGRATPGDLAGRTPPPKLLELWSFEASPYCRKVREVLSELALAALVHNVGKRGRRRPDLVALGGKMQVPYLVDPNTGVAMYESDDIVAYLRKTYG
jgi:glutathione S-transferase